MIRTLTLPAQLRVGAGAVDQLADILEQLGVNRPLVVTDAFLTGRGLTGRLAEALKARGIVTEVFDDTVPDPTTEVVYRAAEAARAAGADALVGFGGGSPIDTAKAAAVMALNPGRAMAEFKAPRVVDVAALPVIAVPTTAGTGSEATRVTVITDSQTQEKMLCMGPSFMPKAAVVDYELTLTKPARLTADTGVDSLTHAIEAYVGRRANPFSDAVALQAMEIIARSLRRACEAPDDREAREAMMWGATLGGMAFSNASVALVHGMSRPIGALFHVPHGLSNAMLLPVVTAWSAPAALARYARCARAMGLASDAAADEAAVQALLAGIASLCADLGVPTPRAFGVSERDWFDNLDLMASQAIESGSPANNPRVPDKAEIVALYEQVWA